MKPFPEGVLSGALSPRQLAAKAKQQPKEAAVLIENGAVARWYESNGWTYPVQGPTASGLAAVQQLFETLGLVKPPKVELSESAVTLRGKPGQRLEYVVTVVTQEKRAAVAYGVSDQPWLTVGRPTYRGQTATIPLIVEEAPASPAPTLTACVKVTANGNQRFDVPVTLIVGDGPAVRSPVAEQQADAGRPCRIAGRGPSPFAFDRPGRRRRRRRSPSTAPPPVAGPGRRRRRLADRAAPMPVAGRRSAGRRRDPVPVGRGGLFEQRTLLDAPYADRNRGRRPARGGGARPAVPRGARRRRSRKSITPTRSST